MKAIKRASLSSDLPTRPRRIIWLNGASSSGKSVLARALQDTIEDLFWHLSIDHFRDAGVLPMARIARQDFQWSNLQQQPFTSFHAAPAGYAGTGNDLSVEHILDDEG